MIVRFAHVTGIVVDTLGWLPSNDMKWTQYHGVPFRDRWISDIVI